MSSTHQAAIGIEGALSAMSLEWDLRGDAAALWAVLPGLVAEGVVVGLGGPLLDAVGAHVPGYRPFERLQQGRHTLPATPHALWTLALGASPGEVFQRAEALKQRLAAHLRVSEARTMFSYRQGRDLTGYQDGTANPRGDEAWAAALIEDGPFEHGSFALVQRWLHFRERFAALPQAERDLTIGRTLEGDVEMDDAPPTAHIKRTEQEDFDPPAFLLRRSMPWGDLRRHGLVFIAFASDLSKPERMLRRMVGLEDGLQDALLGHSQAETGAYYFVPPVADGRLLLPAAQPRPAVAAPAAPMPARSTLTLREHGPLLLAGNFVVAGVPMVRGALCRCGRSADKPFCDGSHAAAGFVAAGGCAAFTGQGRGAARPVIVQPVADGPLVVQGAVELCAADGASLGTVEGPTLCRCGHSANKPFCDGAHARVGFCASE